MDKKYIRKSEVFCVIMIVISYIFFLLSYIQNNKKKMIITTITTISLGYLLSVFAKEMRKLTERK